MEGIKLLLLSGLFLVNSPDMSKAHANAKRFYPTLDASKSQDDQTDSMAAENDQRVQCSNVTFVNSNLSSSPDKPQTLQKNEIVSCLLTNQTKCSIKQSEQKASSKSVLFEDQASLDCIGGKLNPLDEGYDNINGSMNYPGIRPLNRFLKQFKREHVSTRNAPNSMDQINSLKPDSPLTFTCQGRCGMEISFPCSCSASCVVYGTCCDNMTQDCLHVWEEGMTRFDHLLRANTICYDDFIYMISSCPRSLKKNADRKEVKIRTIRDPASKSVNIISESQSPMLEGVVTTSGIKGIVGSNSAKFSKSGSDIQESIVEKLKKLFSAAPVTESDTGFTFINKSIYDCNNMSQNTVLIWSVASAYSVISPTKVEDFERFNILNHYQFEFDKQILNAHQCKQNIIETCNQTAGLDDLYQANAEKCQKSTALIMSTLKFQTGVYYRNVFCAHCNEGSHNKYSLFLSGDGMSKPRDFQLLMSISNSGVINVRLVQSGMLRALLPWSQAHCPIPHHSNFSDSSGSIEESTNSESDGRGICSVTCLSRYFKSQSDGLCKTQHSAFLAIADEGFSPLCPAAMRGLANFLVCGLKSQVETLRYADLSSKSVSVMFDASTNKRLYVIEINLALPSITDKVFSVYKEDVIHNIHRVALLIKSFEKYRSSHALCSLGNQKLKSELPVIHTSSIESYIGMLTFNITLTEGMEQLRGPIVDKQNTTTVCLTPVSISKNTKAKPTHIYCMEDPVHERDTTLLHGLHSSPCFSLVEDLEVPPCSNRADTVMKRNGTFSKWMLARNILILILAKTRQLPFN
ncbi:hypothetical protein PoB_003698300 [Plakobranchus ocellatus]|uniref:SMB domain-containing protein n=1 Tax=Plakobranchus ocellatus TaxID=259542 RepID=A0AAV4ASX5_9GAST|nr:hypothetical protein PoB_003698300 [Plakobranchus ocellatus]